MRFITVTDPGFFRGTAVLIHSIILNGGLPDPGFVVLHTGLREEHKSYLKRISENIEILDVSSLKEIPIPERKISPTLRGRMKKLYIFTYNPGEILCYMDSDMLCVGGLEDIQHFRHFSAALDLGQKGFGCVNGYPMFNSGFMIFRSDDAFNKALSEFARPDHFESKADQWLINDFMRTVFPDDVSIVHSIYNSIITLKAYSPNVYSDLRSSGIRMLHYTNIKPWDLTDFRSMARIRLRKRNVRRTLLHGWRELRAWRLIEADLMSRQGIIAGP